MARGGGVWPQPVGEGALWRVGCAVRQAQGEAAGRRSRAARTLSPARPRRPEAPPRPAPTPRTRHTDAVDGPTRLPERGSTASPLSFATVAGLLGRSLAAPELCLLPRDKAAGSRDASVAARDESVVTRDAYVAERDVPLRARDAAPASRDVTFAARDARKSPIHLRECVLHRYLWSHLMSKAATKPKQASKEPRAPAKQAAPTRSTRKPPSSSKKPASPRAPEPSRPPREPSRPPPAPSAEVIPPPPVMGGPSALERWRGEAMGVPAGALRPRVPLHVLLDEAVLVARFFESYFATVRDEGGGVVRVGLDSVARGGRELTARAGEEVLSLREAIYEAQARYVGASGRRGGPPVVRARFVLREIRAALAFLLDDGKRDVRDVQLEQVEASGKGERRASVLVMRLYQHARFAEMHRAELDGLGGFDVGLIDEAFALVATFQKLPALVPMEELSQGMVKLRNQLATLLARRMATIRAAARFVFRASPAIVREATSVYERRRGVAARRAKLEAKARGAESAPGTRSRAGKGTPGGKETPAAPADGGKQPS